jgi:hypothetical protein
MPIYPIKQALQFREGCIFSMGLRTGTSIELCYRWNLKNWGLGTRKSDHLYKIFSPSITEFGRTCSRGTECILWTEL